MNDFACIHGRRGARRCDLLTQWAKKFMDSPHWEVTDANFATSIIYHLSDYGADITGIYVDQWGLVTAASSTFETHVQWDRLEHGLALTLRLFYKNAGRTKGRNSFA